METPPEAQERGVRPRPERWAASLEAADRMGLVTGAQGAVSPADCDAFGRMRPELVMGRITDAMPYLDIPVREAAAKSHAGAPETIGGASIEFRLAYFDMPKAGARIVLRSGLAASGPKVQTMNHWLLDPLTGRAWASAEMVMVMFDLEARKALAVGPEGQEALRALVVPGLTM
jgi:acyl-CoA thioester hydrolase